MYVLSRLLSPWGLGRKVVIALIASALFFNMAGTLRASTVGTISGTVSNATTGQGLGGVRVSAVAPTGTYRATSNPQGFFSITGVVEDTYTVSLELAGYQPLAITGVTVNADQVADVTTQAKLTKSLVTIGRVTTRAVTGAFQPAQTNDTYTFSAQNIDNELGKKNMRSEAQLISQLPGAGFDSSGYPVIRGGRENEETFQYEGIPYTDAFSNQFVNTLSLSSGVAGFQLVPGTGDASTGSQGTGTLNLISKRGARPSFGSLELAAYTWPFNHQLSTEFGWASPDGRWSNYTSFTGTRLDTAYQARNADVTRLGNYFSRAYQSGATLTDNFVYKFGKDLNQSLQLFWDNDLFTFYSDVGGVTYCWQTCNPFALTNISAFSGLSTAQIQSLTSLYPFDQTSPTTPALVTFAQRQVQPNDTFKVQYAWNVDSSTFLTAKFFHTNSVLDLEAPVPGQTYFDEEVFQGGQNIGATLDATKQLNAQHLLKVGGLYQFLHPIDTVTSGVFGLLAATGFGNGGEGYDFLPPGALSTGYVYNAFGGNPPRVPYFVQQPTMNRQDWAVYLNDTYSPTGRLKIDLGLRVDGSVFRYPSEAPCNIYASAAAPLTVDATSGANQCLFLPNGFNASGQPIVKIDSQARTPIVYEPRAGFSWQIGKNDAIRAAYGRSVEFPPIADVDSRSARSYYISKFGNIGPDPAAGNICGPQAKAPCASLGEQLYWDNQNAINGVPIEPAKPETFSNWDFSISHQFGGGIGLKVTPFYRRSYDALTLVASVKTDKNGNPLMTPTGALLLNPAITTNSGLSKTTGVELLLTRDLAYGLSGQLSATYINEFSNVIPLSSSEDFFPSIPPASLAVGNLYRVGFLSPFQASLALQYKTRSGWRFNPIMNYNKGYPFGNGTINAVYINGVAVNVPSTNTATVNGNVTTPGGSTVTMQYVDPLNPGSLFKANIAATRGGALTPSAGGVLTKSRLAPVNLVVEYNGPGSKSTFGVFIVNVFGNVYGQPAINNRWQPVATGLGGTKTGTSILPLAFPNLGFANYANDRFGYDPFIITPNGATCWPCNGQVGNTPTVIQLYWQLSL